VNPYWILIALGLGAQAVAHLRYLHRKMANDALIRQFVIDVATNHLPHLYHGQNKIGSALGIDLGEPPVIRFAQINGRTAAETKPLAVP
jgi:hypothetical protein